MDPAIVERMRNQMGHRGPDGAGLWTEEDRRVCFGHRRLAIVDLTATADQPMCNEHADIWLTYNGEVYNHLDLRRQLIEKGHVFKTDHSDTEVLVHGFEQWGMAGLLDKISGDYAFGIYSTSERALYVARDRIGVKPLYFAERNGSFLFASEIKALLEFPGIDRDIDPFAMRHYLSFLATPAPLTMFKGIYKLPAGCWLRVGEDGTIAMQRYYSAQPGKGIDVREIKGLRPHELESFYIDGIRTRLAKAVDKRMMSDVPYGVFLSGGIDSSTNVALMSDVSSQRINTFTVGYKQETDLNELHYARIAAERFNTSHHEVLIDEADMMGYLGDLVHYQEEPLADWVCIPLYFVSKLARDSGITVVQVGEGSDEQFGGYAGYLKYLKLYDRFWSPFQTYLPHPIQKMVARCAEALARRQPRLAVYGDIIDRAARDRDHFWILSMSFWEMTKRQLVRTEFAETTVYHDRMIEAGILDPSYLAHDSFEVIKSFSEAKSSSDDVLNNMVVNEFRLRLPELLLMRVDKIAMSASLEARVPFLDHELVDFTFDIPGHWKTKDGVPKYLLKKAVEGLIPHDLIYRKKMGFDVPMAAWLRGSFGRKAEDEIAQSELMQRGFFDVSFIRRMFKEHRDGRANWAQQIWTIYNLVAWYNHWIAGRFFA